MSANRRQHTRLRAQGMAVRMKADSLDALFMVSNISIGGLFIRTTQLLPPGMPVAIELTTRGMRTSLRMLGKIANVVSADEARSSGRSEGMGLQFTITSEADLQRIRELVARQEQPLNAQAEATRPTMRGEAVVGKSEPFGGDREVQRADGREKKPSAPAVSTPPRPLSPARAPAIATPLSPPSARVLVPVLTPSQMPKVVATAQSAAELQQTVEAQREQINRLQAENAQLREELKKRDRLGAPPQAGHRR